MLKLRVRALIGAMIFLGYFMVYIVRYNLSVHIVDMVEVPKRILDTIYSDQKSLRTALNERTGGVLDIMYWNEMRIALLLAAYHIGYCICFPIFHNIGDIFGPTWVVGAAGFTSGVLNCLTSASAYYDFWMVFIVRILIGFCSGAMLPSMIQVLRRWVPPTERHHFMWAYCGEIHYIFMHIPSLHRYGITTGTCCTFLLCSVVEYYFGWSMGFYISGSVQIIWSGIWVMLVTDIPAKHSFISKEELSFLTTAIGTVCNIKLTNSQAPWKLILKSVPFWALCILNFGYAWMIISICIHGPLYYTVILNYSIYELVAIFHISIRPILFGYGYFFLFASIICFLIILLKSTSLDLFFEAAALSALPFFLRLVLGTIIIQTYHWYKNNNKIKRVKHLRKYFIVVSHVIPGTLISTAWLMPINPGPVLLTAATALTAAGMDFTLDICYELSPNYVNSINTVIKIIGNLPGIIVSLCVGEVTYKFKNSTVVWRFIWSFHGTVLLMSGLIFLIWGDTHVQPWNDIKQKVRRRTRVVMRPSIMSNITEVDEDSLSSQMSTPQRIKRFMNWKL